jgi:UDP-N-acetyl-D-glucosamine dehydrogenase
MPESVTGSGSTSAGVVGLGYAGLPLALAMHRAGYDVVGVDVDETVVERLSDGESTVTDVTDEAVATALDDGVTFTTDYDALADVDGVSVCVPTPLRKTDTPDLSYVRKAAERLAPVVPDGCTVILESTVYPGATEEVVAAALAEPRGVARRAAPGPDDGDRGTRVLPADAEVGQVVTEQGGLVAESRPDPDPDPDPDREVSDRAVGEDVFLAFSPERIDPGNEEYGPTEIPKVLGGVTPACADRAEALYEPVFDEVVRVDSATEAELVKLLENTFRAVNVGLINELAQIAHELDVDIWDAIDAAKTKPFGYMPFYPGPGLGGHCIPIDPFYLSWKAREHGIDVRFIDLADTINREMPGHVVDRVVRHLNDRGVPVPSARVLIVGVTYKPDVSDTRESPAIDVVRELSDWGADVAYHDPHVPSLDVDDRTLQSVPLRPSTLETADCVVVVTDHEAVDIDHLLEHAPLVFDTRNATAGTPAAAGEADETDGAAEVVRL